MDLSLPIELAAGYTSRSQIARITTEAWAQRELYCPACDRDALAPLPANEPVADFRCGQCSHAFQLKAKNGPFGPTASNSAYSKKLEAMRLSRVPSYLFLSYDLRDALVTNLFVVPGFFIGPSAIEKRRPLRPTARRAGWEGSNILLGTLPLDARIPMVSGRRPENPGHVRAAWSRIAFLEKRRVEDRGWLAEVMAAIRTLPAERFHLRDLYRMKEQFAQTHPQNRHIEPKLRQQVQRLRDEGFLVSLGAGKYRVARIGTEP